MKSPVNTKFSEGKCQFVFTTVSGDFDHNVQWRKDKFIDALTHRAIL